MGRLLYFLYANLTFRSGALSLTKTEVLKIVRSRWSTKVGLEAHVKDSMSGSR